MELKNLICLSVDLNSDIFGKISIYQHPDSPTLKIMSKQILLTDSSDLLNSAHLLINRSNSQHPLLNPFLGSLNNPSDKVIQLFYNIPQNVFFELGQILHRNLNILLKFLDQILTAFCELEKLQITELSYLNFIAFFDSLTSRFILTDFLDQEPRFFFTNRIFSFDFFKSLHFSRQFYTHLCLLAVFALTKYFNFSEDLALEFLSQEQFRKCEIKCEFISKIEEAVQNHQEEIIVIFLLNFCRLNETQEFSSIAESYHFFQRNVIQIIQTDYLADELRTTLPFENPYLTHSFAEMTNVSSANQDFDPTLNLDTCLHPDSNQQIPYSDNLTLQRFKKTQENEEMYEDPGFYFPGTNSIQNESKNEEKSNPENVFFNNCSVQNISPNQITTTNFEVTHFPKVSITQTSQIKNDNWDDSQSDLGNRKNTDFLQFADEAIETSDLNLDDDINDNNQNYEIDFLKSQKEDFEENKFNKRIKQKSGSYLKPSNIHASYLKPSNAYERVFSPKGRLSTYDNFIDLKSVLPLNKGVFSVVAFPVSSGNSTRNMRLNFQHHLTPLNVQGDKVDMFMLLDPDYYTPNKSTISRNFDDDFDFIEPPSLGHISSNIVVDKNQDKQRSSEFISYDYNVDFGKNKRFVSEFLIKQENNLKIKTLKNLARTNFHKFTRKIADNQFFRFLFDKNIQKHLKQQKNTNKITRENLSKQNLILLVKIEVCELKISLKTRQRQLIFLENKLIAKDFIHKISLDFQNKTNLSFIKNLKIEVEKFVSIKNNFPFQKSTNLKIPPNQFDFSDQNLVIFKSITKSPHSTLTPQFNDMNTARNSSVSKGSPIPDSHQSFYRTLNNPLSHTIFQTNTNTFSPQSVPLNNNNTNTNNINNPTKCPPLKISNYSPNSYSPSSIQNPSHQSPKMPLLYKNKPENPDLNLKNSSPKITDPKFKNPSTYILGPKHVTYLKHDFPKSADISFNSSQRQHFFKKLNPPVFNNRNQKQHILPSVTFVNAQILPRCTLTPEPVIKVPRKDSNNFFWHLPPNPLAFSSKHTVSVEGTPIDSRQSCSFQNFVLKKDSIRNQAFESPNFGKKSNFKGFEGGSIKSDFSPSEFYQVNSGIRKSPDIISFRIDRGRDVHIYEVPALYKQPLQTLKKENDKIGISDKFSREIVSKKGS